MSEEENAPVKTTVEVKCHICGNIWAYTGKNKDNKEALCTCPACGRKTHVDKEWKKKVKKEKTKARITNRALGWARRRSTEE